MRTVASYVRNPGTESNGKAPCVLSHFLQLRVMFISGTILGRETRARNAGHDILVAATFDCSLLFSLLHLLPADDFLRWIGDTVGQ